MHRVGELVNVVDQLPQSGSEVMESAGLCNGHWTQGHFPDGILNAQKYRDEFLGPIIAAFIHDDHLRLQHDDAWPM